MGRELFTLNIITSRLRFHRRLSEWHMAAVMMAIGFMFMSSNTFDLPHYGVLRQIADQSTWAWTMVVIGSVRLAVLTVNGTMRRGSPHLRAFLSSVSAIIWSIDLAGIMAFGTPVQAGPFLACAAIVDIINATRAAQDARLEDDEKSGEEGWNTR